MNPRLNSAVKVTALAAAVIFSAAGFAQDNSSTSNWSTTTQQQDPNGAFNPSRTKVTHTEADGRSIDNKSVQVLGPDGRYVPYSDVETESVKVNSTTVRTIQRAYGTDVDGRRVLVQVREEESSKLPGGEMKVTRTTSNPDADGKLQVVQREIADSKLVSPDVRDTKTTVLTPDIEGRFSPSVQIDERQKKNSDGSVEFKKSTQTSDGSGGWQTSEVREGVSKVENGQEVGKEETVSRPNGDGKLGVVERTVTKASSSAPGDSRRTTETYSTNVPGVANDSGLQLVRRETISSQTSPTGEHSTTRQVEHTTPGTPEDGLRVTEKTIDIVRPGANGMADQKRTVMGPDADGRLREVWVDVGKTDNPAAVQVDTKAPPKQQ
ncbi:MAG TPA: hypothetical protein VF753_11595 [Terriglobales bacterium]